MAVDMNVALQDDGIEGLMLRVQSHIAQALQVVQNSSQSSNRKHLVTLHKLQQGCARIVEETPKGTKLVGEKIFNMSFTTGVIYRVLAAPKGLLWAERTCRFVASFVAFCVSNTKSANLNEEETLAFDDTASRFTDQILKTLIKGMSATDKTVRFRSTQLTAQVITALPAIDEDIYERLKSSLLERANDKEMSIRLQSILAIAKLSSTDDKDVERALIQAMRHDKSAEIRRAGLLNCRLTPETICPCIERVRDVDTLNRKAVFARFMHTAEAKTASSASQSSFDVFWRQRLDSLVHLLATGLRDRDESVKTVAKRLSINVVNSLTDQVTDFIRVSQ